MQSIPKLDLSHFTHGSDSQKHNFVNELGYAYEHIGFVAIRNHGIPNEVLTDLYREVKNFFDLSERVKMQYDDSMGGGQRGYTGFGKEHAKNRNAGDLKEFWHFGQYTEGATVEVPSYPANKVVAELPSFNKAGETIYKALEETGIQILRAIALHLVLDEN
jgi:isopenicillin N synthase-like dioxygenase